MTPACRAEAEGENAYDIGGIGRTYPSGDHIDDRSI